MPGKILIVDDAKDMLLLLKRIISEETDYQLFTESNPVKALETVKEHPIDLVVTDLKMPKMDGIKLLEAVKTINPEVAVIILTAYATIESAVEATKKGAHDYITKPFKRERVLLTIDKVMKYQRVVRENLALRQALGEEDCFPVMVGASSVMRDVFAQVKQVAPTMATVLITGPSGTGKELVARALHQYSSRRSQKMVTINCTAIPEHVVDSELFGHLKGSFTGAWKDKKGLVEEANLGTLFLDEIGDLGPNMQTKLLRLLEEGEYRPVGSTVTRKADVRFIAATNHNLLQDIVEKRFREDLYYRLAVVHIYLPPLREKREDIPLLSYHFLNKFTLINQKKIENISPAAMRALLSHDYPGNVRELENIIERAVIFCQTNTIGVMDLFLGSQKGSSALELEQDVCDLPFKEAKEKALKLFHTKYIRSLLQESGGNISKAAESAGIQRQYLHRLMKEAGIDAEDFKHKPEQG